MASAFGDEVKRLRGERSQKSIADAVGVNQSFISKLEIGERDGIGADLLYRLCDVLGVPCDHFRAFFPAMPPADPPRPMGKRK